MKTESQRAGELFDVAVKLGETERIAYLDRMCGSDPGLRQEVEAMLATALREGSERANPTGLTDLYRSATLENVGDVISRYKLLQKLGEGGCGVVYLAEQTEPVRRRVALKVIKLGMDTRQVIARFEAERQALAMMDHPNIAKVLDAGQTDAGRPFFVMELVKGVPLTEFCDREKLVLDDRLKLFMQVCHAIQHAHVKGIIHRDIKPSNVLVSFQDGKAIPKVIDFGIAKATEGRLTDKTLCTALEQFIGTPAYMSPEQAEMSSIDIDTRSDIYSLGVLLYELLTGKTPFDTHELLKAGIDEIRRIIREDDPPKPSTRLTTLDDPELAKVVKNRRSEAPRLVKLVRGDLDWIVMKSLEKERTRRYETANEFARDLERHLLNEPIMARPAGAWEKALKWTRRHPTSAALAIVIVLSSIVCAVLAAYAWNRAILANRSAAEASRARRAAEIAQKEATDSLNHLLGRSQAKFRIENLELTEQKGDGMEARLKIDYRFDDLDTETARVVAVVGQSGNPRASSWFGSDPVRINRGSGTVGLKVRYFNDEPGVPAAIASDQIRILVLNETGGAILGLTEFAKTILWGDKTKIVVTNTASSPSAHHLSDDVKTKVTNVDVVNRSVDRSQMTIGVEFEYNDQLREPLMGVDVTQQHQPDVTRYFSSVPREIGTSKRNFIYFRVTFRPPPELAAGETYPTDTVVVFFLDKATGRRYNIFKKTMFLSWKAGPPQETVVP